MVIEDGNKMVKDFKDIIRSKKKSSIKQDEALGNFFNELIDPNIFNHLNISKNNFYLEMAT